jgi:hypothetical protein
VTLGPCSRAEIVEGGVFVPTAGTVQSAVIRSLIVAAPDLLAACHALVESLHDDLSHEHCAAWDACRDAIARATRTS